MSQVKCHKAILISLDIFQCDNKKSVHRTPCFPKCLLLTSDDHLHVTELYCWCILINQIAYVQLLNLSAEV